MTPEELIRELLEAASTDNRRADVSESDAADNVVMIAKCCEALEALQELRGQAILLKNAQEQLAIQTRIIDELRKLVRDLRADVERLRRDYHKRTN